MTERAKDLLNLELPRGKRAFDVDATTGIEADTLVQRVDRSDAPDWAKVAALSIVRAYGLRGVTDPAYIANTIHHAFAGRASAP
jgi:hypothetical protein